MVNPRHRHRHLASMGIDPVCGKEISAMGNGLLDASSRFGTACHLHCGRFLINTLLTLLPLDELPTINFDGLTWTKCGEADEITSPVFLSFTVERISDPTEVLGHTGMLFSQEILRRRLTIQSLSLGIWRSLISTSVCRRVFVKPKIRRFS